MAGVRRIGRFWRLDTDGFIQNDAAPEKISPLYAMLVDEITAAYLDHLGGCVRGVYVRGTVARGIAVEGISDIDDFALLDRDPSGLDLSWAEGASEYLRARHPFVTGVGLECLGPKDIGSTDRFSETALLTVTQTACVWGEDVAAGLPRYRPGVLVAKNDIVQIEADIEEAAAGIERDSCPENTLYWCRRTAKNIVRTGFSLTITEQPRFTRDLYPCYATFGRLHSERRSGMRFALEYALDPSPEAENVLSFLKGFGGWMIEAANDWLDLYNPSRELALKLDEFPEEVRY